MSALVVARLEVVEVEHNQRQRPVVPDGAMMLVVQPLLERAMVRQAGEPVGTGRKL